MSENAESRTEQASPKRQAEARRKGQVPMSRDLTMAATLMAALAVLAVMSDSAIARVVMIVREWLTMAGNPAVWAAWSGESLHVALLKMGSDSLVLVLPLAACIAVTATGLTFIQSGFNWRTEGLGLDITRLSLVGGAKRLVSLRSLVELIKSLFKVALVFFVGHLAVRTSWDDLPVWVQLSVNGVLGTTGGLMLNVTLWVGLTLLGLAGFDYGYQRYEWRKQLRMTKQELKQEGREADGDPQMKSRIRTMQRDMGRKRMMAAVPKATVVVTNPTHIAVALRYDQGTMAAPVVVAKGAGFIAERIKEIAREHGVMIIERPVVARSLYKLAEIGKEIPLDLYRAVAELLAMVYRAKNLRVDQRDSRRHLNEGDHV